MTPACRGIVVALNAAGEVASTGLGNSIGATVAKLWATSGAKNKCGESRMFYDVDGQTVAAVSTGEIPKNVDQANEVIRKTTAIGVRALKSHGIKDITVEGGHDAAVGAILSTFEWNMKSTKAAKEKLEPVEIKNAAKNESAAKNWQSGVIYGQAQNLARELMTLPANVCTPTYFCARAAKEFAGVDKVELIAHDKAWAEEKKMGSFLSVTHGSAEPCKFLEVHYRGGAADQPPIAFVGKGITFDSGGISLKPGAGMKDMRADMGGAATTLAATWAIAKLGLPVNIVLCIPLTENLPGPTATKPGDVVVAANGVTIEVDNTDAEGRLVLADALYYASSTFKPEIVINVATLTGAMMIALGNQFTGVFTNSDELWADLDTAGAAEHDRLWRMPLDEGYAQQITHTGLDLCNTGGRLAGSCTAAIFLKRFVDGLIVDGTESTADNLIKWAHMDIAGVMDLGKSDAGYNLGGMTGRPVRALIEYVRRATDKAAAT